MSIAPIRTLKKNFGGNIVYYDGTTVIGRANVPTGSDVLHPSFTVPSKTGKTFVGWGTTTSITNWVGTLVATGEPMDLYALYVDNSLTVVTGSGSGGGDDMPSYTVGTKNTDYVTGDVSVLVSADTAGQHTDSKTFVLNKRRYASASATYWSAAKGNATVYFDGTAKKNSTYGWTSDYQSITPADGSHTVGVSIYRAQQDAGTRGVSCGITSLVLSNPIAWT